MEVKFRTIEEKKLVGKRLKMSIADNKTPELWKSFMQRRKEIKNTVGPDLYSMQTFDPLYFKRFNPLAEFEKWATTEVSHFEEVPEEMDMFVLKEGLYAVFLHKGYGSGDNIFDYIFNTWLPGSGYELDDRPHFEILGQKYKNNDPDSEEEIWIRVKILS